MIDEPQLVQTIAVRAAVIHVTVPRERIREVMGPSHKELLAGVAAQGIAIIGPYDGLPGGWDEFNAWIKAKGLRTVDAPWECYAVAPESGAAPTTWRTELNLPLVD